jgi:peptidoglycan/LPS O-acetylase OafA/YrhL
MDLVSHRQADAALDRVRDDVASKHQAQLYPPLDGLRAVAVLMVIGVHGTQFVLARAHGSEQRLLEQWYTTWSLGRTGVELFFVLSGFLLFMPYARSIHQNANWPNVRLFYRRRLRRVGPAYWFSLAVLGFASSASAGDLALHALFLHNVSFGTYRSINDVFWSMAVEVQFYALLPLIAFAVARFRDKAVVALLAATPATQAILLIINWLGVKTLPYRPAMALLSYLSVFGAGICGAWLVVRSQNGDHRAARWVSVMSRGGVVVLVLVLFLDASNLWHTRFQFMLWEATLGIGYAGLLLAALVTWPRLGKFLTLRPLVLLGLISYSAYIWHVPMYGRFLDTLTRITGGRYMLITWLIFVGVVAIPVFAFSYLLLERPFHRKTAR